MKTTLVSFIGRKPKGEYQETTYDFGGVTRKTSFFGRALAEFCRPDRMVILGTSGSMWEILLDQVSDSAGGGDDIIALMEGSENQTVSQEMLDTVAPLVEAKMGIPCRLSIIPLGRDEQEQMEILRMMVKDIEKNEQVILDLTHGLRHLPMLAFLSALYLESAKSATISKIYYGAYDLKTGNDITPVLQLDGLLRTAHWIRALNTYDKDGDYSVFEPLLEQEGLGGNSLAEAAFFERSTNPEKARGKLTGFRPEAMREKPVAGLFAEPLRERIAWFRGQTRSEWESSLARIYFEKRDYLRAVIYALESLVTREIEARGGNVANFDERKETLTRLRQNDQIADFSNLRNSLTHGVKPTDRGATSTLRDEGKLREAVRRFIDQYLGRK